VRESLTSIENEDAVTEESTAHDEELEGYEPDVETLLQGSEASHDFD